MTTPEPTPIRPMSFAERFWSHARGPETEEVPEPLRSVVLVRHFLAVLSHFDGTPRKAAPALVAMLRQAELEGDLSYASPEQVRGEILDTRSVVFSLGVVLFERLTGRHPFGAENNRPRQVDRIRRGELGSGVNSFPTVAAGLRSVLVRAMSPFPEERWPDLRQMRELLGQFLTQEAPAPRLPGTASDATEEGVEQTRVVRRATDFGRELMQVVARHDREPSRAEGEPLRGAGPRASQRIAVPSAGVATVTPAGPPRRPPRPTPQAGSLRAVPPPVPPPQPPPTEDSVATTRVDPLGPTQKVMIDDHALARSIDRALAEVDPVAPAPVPPPAPPTLPVRAETPSPFPLAAAQPMSPTSFDGPFMNVDLRGTARRRTLMIAVGSALLGAAVAVALVVGMQGGSSGPAPAPAAAPAVAPAAAPAAATAPAPATATATAPAPEPAPAPVVTIESSLADAVAPCLAAAPHKARVFGLSILFKAGAVQKPYFAADGALTPRERGCMSKALRGLAIAGAPAGKVQEYVVRVDAGGIAFAAH